MFLWDPKFFELNQRITACTKCSLLCGKDKIYPTFGNFPQDLSKVKVVFIGQAPGHPLKEELEWKNKKLDVEVVDELYKLAMQKSRFGKWLGKLINNVGLTWDEVAFVNAVKCFPPEHKISDEMKTNCVPYLHEQLSFVQPKIYVTFGVFALEQLTGQRFREKIEKYHAHLIELNGKKIVPSFHPAFMFRKQKKYGNVTEMLQEEIKRAIKDE